jgi:hypothetical protein
LAEQYVPNLGFGDANLSSYLMRFRKQHPLIKILNGTLVDLPTPANISVN